jgi:type I restriction enzyme R subunit
MPLNEADTCRTYVTPNLREVGWESSPHSLTEQHTFTDGRVITMGGKPRRGERKRADYLLRYRRNFMIGVVEAKPEDTPAAAGLQQAKEYAEILGLKFAYATNGHEIIEFDYTTGTESIVPVFPTPAELWTRLTASENITKNVEDKLLTPFNVVEGAVPRYYQEIAINRTVQAILQGKRRVLLTMATGTGKTVVAFQIAWKLWSARWNRTGAYRKPRILFLADRNILVDDPKDKTFAPFAAARFKLEGGRISKGREMYFAIYQAIAKDERRPGLYKEFSPDFFDLIIIDECHRGSSRDESNWREILEYFEPAYQLGMTATPLREDNRDTYQYFGNPIYTYSLRDGIDDGFLAPYRVHRVVTEVDAAGWRPSKNEIDRYGKLIPDKEYTTQDFERLVVLQARTQAIAKHLTDYMKRTNRFAKTIVFCVDQEHALVMRQALTNLNADLVKDHPDYVSRVTADEGGTGRGYLSKFQELETVSPVILTTSQLLTTGVDAPMCKNVVLTRVVNAMTEFKQIIGRGTRIREDYGKLYFNIIDYTGSATSRFADPSFDGYPDVETEVEIDIGGTEIGGTNVTPNNGDETSTSTDTIEHAGDRENGEQSESRAKYYVDGGHVEIAAQLVYELDADGKQLRVVQYTDYTAEKVRTLFTSPEELRDQWANPLKRLDVLQALDERGIDFDKLAEATGKHDADPFDILCHLAFSSPVRTRSERAQRLRKEDAAFFERYSPEAREILSELLDKYTEYGPRQFTIPDALQLPPISHHGKPSEISKFFGGARELRHAVDELQNLLYAS